MRKYVCCDDIGNIINPLIVAGQVHGGLVQGIAQALWEEAVYDDAGTLVSGSFVDYLLPTAADTISFDIDHTTSAVDDQHARHQGRRRGRHHRLDAGGRQRGRRRVRHLGVNDIQMPCTPERVWKAINTSCGQGGATEGAAMPHFDDVRTRYHAAPEGAEPVIPAQFDYVAPTSVEEALAALAAARRRREDHRRRAEPAAGAPDAAQRARGGHRPRQDREPARRPRRRRRDRDRRDDHALRGRHRRAGRGARVAAVEGGGELADAQIRHRGTFGGALRARRPGR